MGTDQVAGWSGECVVVYAGRRIIVACRSTSTAGPSILVAVGAFVRRGLRVGADFSEVARSESGAPLRWSADADERCIHWEDRGVELRGRFGRVSVPMTVPILPLPGTAGADVIPPRVSGRCRLGRVAVEVPHGDVLVPLAGRHRAVLVSGPSVIAEAVRTARALRVVRARRRVAEPY